MIDFRYHLVSLAAVFIALAVGIVLGAGPLREGISETLDEEVAQLRDERTDLRTQLEATGARADAKDEAVELTGPRAVSGSLTGSRVGVVVLPGADRDQIAQVEDRVQEAGGSVVLRAELDAAWETSPHAALVDELAVGLQVPGDQDDITLGRVIGALLAGADEDGSLGAWLGAAERLEEEGLLDLSWVDESNAPVTDRRPPEALLVVSGGLSVLAERPDDPEALAVLERRTDLLTALADLEVPLVVAAAGTEDGALAPGGGQDPVVRSVRESAGLGDEISTVDDLEGSSGRVAATLALAWEIQDEVGHYGLGIGSDAPVPVAPPLRLTTNPLPDQPDATEPVPDDATATSAP